MARYLVTGGAGFIGSHISARCLEEGHEVVAFDNLLSGSRENLEAVGLGTHEGLRFVEGDMRDAACLREAMQGCDGVFHEAALPSVPRSVEDPRSSHEINVDGSFEVLMAARDLGAKVVYAGSSSAYGDSETLPKHEEMVPAPRSPYAAQKLTVEHFLQAFATVYDMKVVILRYFNVFGPRQRADSPYSGVIAKFCTSALDGSTCRIDGDGLQSRDFTYVSDVARGNLLAMQREVPPGLVINLAGGNRYSLLDLVASLERIVGHDIPTEHGAPRAGDVKHSMAAVDRAAEQLAFHTEISFEEGLERTLEWYRESATDA